MTVKIPVTERYQGEHISKPFFRRYRIAMGKDNDSVAEWMRTECRIPFSDWHLDKWGARMETSRYPYVLEFDREEDATLFLLRWS